MEPLVLFLFGKSGSGKTFVGDMLEEALGWHVYHADDDLTAEMKAALRENQPFTDAMRDRYFAVVAENILALKNTYRRLVVTQGAYKKRHRDYLLSKIPDLELIHISSTDSLVLERLSHRQDGIGSASAAALSKDFEAPGKGIKVIANNGSTLELARQLSAIAEQMPHKFSSQDVMKLRLCNP